MPMNVGFQKRKTPGLKYIIEFQGQYMTVFWKWKCAYINSMNMRWIWGENEIEKEATEITYFYLHLVHMELETTGINANFLSDIWD